MRHETQPLEVKASVAVGQGIRVDRFREKTIQITGPFDASIDIEGSLDGSNWAKLITGITLPGIFGITRAVVWVRTNTTVWNSGTPVGLFAAFDSRTDGG